MGGTIQALRDRLYGSKMEMAIIGLENSGKTTFLNQLAEGEAKQTVPTVGLNVKTVKKGKLKMKVWDLGGQVQYRPEWLAYSQGCNILVFLIDASNPELLPISKRELFQLLENKELNSTPILVLSNKIDLQPHLSEQEIIQGMNLDYLMDNPWQILPISAKTGQGVETAIEWILETQKNLAKGSAAKSGQGLTEKLTA